VGIEVSDLDRHKRGTENEAGPRGHSARCLCVPAILEMPMCVPFRRNISVCDVELLGIDAMSVHAKSLEHAKLKCYGETACPSPLCCCDTGTASGSFSHGQPEGRSCTRRSELC
jgi:hypothetical protein